MFKTSNDVEAWLAPMNYEEFWRAIKPHCLVIPRRAACDAQIATGEAVFDDVLAGLKVLAGHLLKKRHGLTRKPAGPMLRVVSSRD